MRGLRQVTLALDQKPLGGLVATDIWQPGDIIRDPLSIPLPADLSPGSYDIRLGVYSPETGERLPVSGSQATENGLHLLPLSLP